MLKAPLRKVLGSKANPMKSFIRHVFPNTFHFMLNNLPQFQYTKLTNGLMVATEERDVCNACMGIFVDAGSRYESAFENGITHFFQHICFKGTNARTRTVMQEQMTQTGAVFDCSTTRELASYRAHCLSAQAPVCFELLVDGVFNNAHSESEVERERSVVALEMEVHDHDTERVLDDYLHASAFQDTPLGQTVMGRSTNLANFSGATISRYMNKYFTASRTALVTVGGVKHEQMVSLAEAHLSELEPSKCPDDDVYRFTGSEIRVRDDSMPQALVALAVEAPALCDPDRVAMEVAREVLGGWDEAQGGGGDHGYYMSRAAASGFARAYGAFYWPYKDTGLFGVKLLSGGMDAGDMLLLVQEQLMRLVHLVTEAEVNRAKRLLKTKLLSRDLQLGRACSEAALWVLHAGGREGLEARVSAVDAVRAADVHAACDKYLYDRCPVVVAIGPTETVDDYTRICSNMYWLRT